MAGDQRGFSRTDRFGNPNVRTFLALLKSRKSGGRSSATGNVGGVSLARPIELAGSSSSLQDTIPLTIREVDYPMGYSTKQGWRGLHSVRQA